MASGITSFIRKAKMMISTCREISRSRTLFVRGRVVLVLRKFLAKSSPNSCNRLMLTTCMRSESQGDSGQRNIYESP